MSAGAEVAVCAVCEQHTVSRFRIEGMDCQDEVHLLERRLGRLSGFEGLSADILNQRLNVTHDAVRLSAGRVAEAVNATGMRAWLEHEGPSPAGGGAATNRVRLVVLSGAAFAAGLLLEALGAGRVPALLAYAVSIVAGGVQTIRRAWSAARLFSLDMNVLMLVAVCGAVAIGQWSEAAAVIFLFALAQHLETRSMDRARHAIRALVELAPAEALVRRDGRESTIPAEALAVGDTVIVRPGEKIPVDGRITDGASDVNQAPITGEALPVDKQAGDEVFAGTINGHGALVIEVTRVRHDTTMARIISLVETAQTRRAPAQAFVDRFARFYTPSVLAVAAAVAVVQPLAFHRPFGDWFYRALVLLVISCPCALVISTPVSIVSALAGAARRGLLIKGGVHLERAAAVRVVAFDKTGTLTRGRPEVVETVGFDGVEPAQVRLVAAAIESRSEHPIARAIIRSASGDGVALPAGEGFRALPGLGAEASVGGEPVLIGNHRLFEERGLCSPAIDRRVEAMGQAGRTAVLVARGGRTLGLIGVADRTRDTAREALDQLRRAGIAHVVMLTGDNEQTAAAIASHLGIHQWRSELLPADKVTAIEDLKRRYGAVAMVGDGVNDAPALAAADIGIAMGAAGADAALETADVALMADDLLAVPGFFSLGRATVRNIRANIAVALGLKAAFLALAVAGVATLWMAVVADMGASLIVIANGLRLLRPRRPTAGGRASRASIRTGARGRRAGRRALPL
jgi:Zn2+/Cd2+-exporting ATPase